ncbi:MAG: hypothetical protein P1Q69_16765 [Candidatus Thorarchaeota archaeon]|nr:hypothetical protein [Candidatus Thorarchaeota archaeon]
MTEKQPTSQPTYRRTTTTTPPTTTNADITTSLPNRTQHAAIPTSTPDSDQKTENTTNTDQRPKQTQPTTGPPHFDPLFSSSETIHRSPSLCSLYDSTTSRCILDSNECAAPHGQDALVDRRHAKLTEQLMVPSCTIYERASEILSANEVEAILAESETETKSDEIEPRMYKGIDVDELERKYKEGFSQRALADGYNVSRKVIQNIFSKFEIEARPVGFQEIKINPDEVYDLYFNKGWTLREMIEHFECKSTDPILRVMDENGGKTQYQESLEAIEQIDPDEVYTLYNEEGYSLRRIGEIYGVSIGPIRRMFIENEWEYGQEIKIDRDELYRLYFTLGLTRDEVTERMGVSRKVFDRVFDEEGWEARPQGFQPVDIEVDEYKRLYYVEELELEKMAEQLNVSVRTVIRFREEQGLEDRVLKYGKDLRDEIFGTECRLCGNPYEHVHKKDGVPHDSHILWSRKSLLQLNPDDWAALCVSCHQLTHALMKVYGLDWEEIEEHIKELVRKRNG